MTDLDALDMLYQAVSFPPSKSWLLFYNTWPAIKRELEAGRLVIAALRIHKTRIEEDERFHYPPANTDVNAPLTLIQTTMEAQLAVCNDALAAYDAAVKEKP